MSSDKNDSNCNRPTGSFYVMLVLNCMMWLLIILSYSCVKIYKTFFNNNISFLENNNISNKNTVSTQTHTHLSTIVIHPDLDLGIIKN